jgi:translation initiation factor 2 alpha subunit (eIF-2alpha)
MSILSIPFYNINKPSNEELVIVKLTEKTDSYFKGHLLEYNCSVFMNYSDATKKRNVTSWNKLIPLNKEMIVNVDDCNYEKDIVKVSAVNNVNEDKFIKNKKLYTLMNKLSIDSGENINELWTNIIYKIDKIMRDSTDIIEGSSILEFINEKKEEVIEIINNKEISDKLYSIIDNMNKEAPYDITSHIEIVSTGGVENTKKLIEESLKTISFEYTLKYNTTPFITLTSNSKDSVLKDHDKFIEILTQEGLKIKQQIFVRCDRNKKKV